MGLYSKRHYHEGDVNEQELDALTKCEVLDTLGAYCHFGLTSHDYDVAKKF